MAAIAALPVAVWEFSLGVCLVVKGFRPSPITAEMAAASTPPAYQRRHRLTAGQHGRALQGPGRVDVGAHRTRFTGRMAKAPMMAQSPATAYSTP